MQVPEQVLQTLEALISSLIGQSSTFGTAVLTSEHLLKILDVFKGIRKVVLCKVRCVCSAFCIYCVYTVCLFVCVYCGYVDGMPMQCPRCVLSIFICWLPSK